MERTLSEKLKYINENRERGRFALRIASELSYLAALAKYDSRVDRDLLGAAAEHICRALDCSGAVTRADAEAAEDMLAPLCPVAKDYTEIFTAHAHIDMNWMWGYNETAALTVDTVRTVLGFMRDYPGFTFAQSQASVYEIIERFAPSLLPEIRERIRSGQWEVTAAEWVEPDKNMPSGESMTRQVLETRKYLGPLLGLSDRDFDLCFDPDTFGHSAYVPEILSDAGVRYMYHCRGYDLPCLYEFVAPSGKKTLNYCEYAWYNGTVTTEKFEILPDFCGKYGIKTYLCVYGVGDHGGGPSRRDIENILEYASWPLTPSIRFGRIRDLFAEAEKIRDGLPQIGHELNYLFTGCYTTQSRIKMSNRISEARIFEAEALSAMDRIFGGEGISPSALDRAWRNILFNHFHDILPGSGTVETREFAMGRFQDTLAHVGTVASETMRRISAMTDTSGIPAPADAGGTSEGAGAGFAQNAARGYLLHSAERGSGSTRIFTVFNPTQYRRRENAVITVWDYGYDTSLCEVRDGSGEVIPFTLSGSQESFWGHRFNRLEAAVDVPPFGYTTVVLSQKKPEGLVTRIPRTYEHNDAFINDDDKVLDNGTVRAVFDSRTMILKSFSAGGRELVRGGGYFRLASENPVYGMTAWRVGPTASETNINLSRDVRFRGMSSTETSSGLRYTAEFGSSKIDVKVSLPRGSRTLEFAVTADWDERPVKDVSIPRLDFVAPVAYSDRGEVLTDVPMGRLVRKAVTHDIPCLSYIVPLAGDGGECLALMTDCKYGYRFDGGTAKVSLIRSAYNPDPYPERGIHEIRIGISAAGADGALAPELSSCFCHPLSAVSAKSHPGVLPLSASALTVEGAAVSALKISEDGEGVAVRLYGNGAAHSGMTECGDKRAQLGFRAGAGELSAALTDSLESEKRGDAECRAGSVSFRLGECACATAVIKTEKKA